ncbi:hypothetical protein [Anaeromyxobacter sp. SG17]|uniref:hypothetical protein n=1 Tax=Anaeromyxobacter sp. SG17 TaxID=2925405 RepID=UPI001F575E15|nr:hypothetical protein [Anaeromyxobacter sp. SG17]
MASRQLLLGIGAAVAVAVGVTGCSSGGEEPSNTTGAQSATPPVAESREKRDGVDGGRARAFRAALEAEGFIVQDGLATFVDPIDALDQHAIDSASGFNFPQYYKRFVVPAHPDQGGGIDEASDAFKLAPNEAIVYAGGTPPRGDYFSFCPMLWARYPGVRVTATGDWVFASLRDPLNDLRIRTEGSGNPFHKNTIVVFTADEGIYERVAKSACAAGYPASMLNSYVLPGEELRMGIGEDADTLFFLLRTANFTSEAEGRHYLHDDSWARVYRVTPRVAPTLQPFPTPAWRDRTFTHETVLVPGLLEALDRLGGAILDQTAATSSRQFESVRWFADSKDVLEDDPASPAFRAFVAGESSDTPYFRTAEDGAPSDFTLGDDDMVVVYGVNHAAIGVATYSSFAVYGDWVRYPCPDPGAAPRYLNGCGDPIWNGVASMNSHDFAGSAERYLPGDPMARYLYAVRVVRKARAAGTDPYRVVVPEPDPNPYGFPEPSGNGIPLENSMMIGYRAYLNPVTRSGPRHEDIVPDRAIWFRLAE